VHGLSARCIHEGYKLPYQAGRPERLDGVFVFYSLLRKLELVNG
jgi:hypothetical protein